jgi:hypothetical protein
VHIQIVRDYSYAVRRDYSSPDCTGSTSNFSCVVVPLDFLLVDRTSSHRASSHGVLWHDYIIRIAWALLRLCRASGRVVSPLDFSSVGRTGSRCASGHCVLRRDYSSFGLHQLYCTYAVHPDAPSRHSTSHRLVSLAFAVRLVTTSHGATTRHPDCTGSTEPMSCIWTRRLAAQLVVSWSHWLLPCVRSFHCAL